MSIDVLNETSAELDELELVACARYVMNELRVHPRAELCVRLVDEDAMTTLHERWMDLPGPTDVMSFPMDELREPADDEEAPLGLLGDIVLCPTVTARQAAENGREPDAEAEYLLIHGLLHLLGHDHAEPEEKAVMFGLNDKIIAAWELARR